VTAPATTEAPSASSSQPTGCLGRRLASTAPTVAALSMASTYGTASAPNPTRSARPACRDRRSNQTTVASPSRVSAHSAQASQASGRRLIPALGVPAARGR
jgi:hypothetical protein